jgi:hypothetical protein
MLIEPQMEMCMGLLGDYGMNGVLVPINWWKSANNYGMIIDLNKESFQFFYPFTDFQMI